MNVSTFRRFLTLFYLILAPAVYGQTYTVLYNFGSTGCDPIIPVNNGIIAQGRDGSLYSTAGHGCPGNGTAFKISANATMTVLHSFNGGGGDGYAPNSGLTLTGGGTFVGTTEGADFNAGTLFVMTPNGTLTNLDNAFGGTKGVNGGEPIAPPIQGMDGNYYGMTTAGGDVTKCTSGNGGCGVIYRITPSGRYTVIHTFEEGEGANPKDRLLLAADGNLYGTTFYGGTVNSRYIGNGVIFKITPAGQYTGLYVFCSTNCLDGGQPAASLTQGLDGNFYGTTIIGGTHLFSNFFGGTIFKLTPQGVYSVLYNFCSQPNCSDGGQAVANLIQATDGNFYGTTQVGGANGYGVIFQLTPEGQYTVLYNFDFVHGLGPLVPLTQGTNGVLYGDTSGGGSGHSVDCGGNGCGVFYSLDMGLPSYANLETWWGQQGSTIELLGQGFTGTTGVSFNGTPATFQVVSDTYLTAVVPPGATVGLVTVNTPKGALTSNIPFRVLPYVGSFTPTSGPVGTSVTINGSGFTGTIGVGFGDTNPAQFTVNSDSQITATVPSGAKTGPVGVETKTGTAISTQIFTVTQ